MRTDSPVRQQVHWPGGQAESLFRQSKFDKMRGNYMLNDSINDDDVYPAGTSAS
jgi:hypothetical protein